MNARAPGESRICSKASCASACILVLRRCMFLLSLTATCQVWTVSLKAGLYTYKLLACFIEAHHGIARIVGQPIGLQHILHTPDERGIRLGGDTPGLDDPRLDVIFFRACHTVTVLMVSIKPKTTSSSASSCKVQWQRPRGGSLQASSSNVCSTLPLILTLSGRGGCGRWSRAASRPSVTNRFRRRSMVRGLVPKAETISASAYASPHHSSAKSTMRAWVSFRAAA